MTRSRATSLAQSASFRAATRGLTQHDSMLYVSGPELLKTIVVNLERSERRDFSEVVEMFGLDAIKSLSAGGDYTASSATVWLVVDKDSRAYKILEQPAAARVIPKYLPQSTYFFASLGVGSGRETWQKINHFLSRKLMRIGDVRDVERYQRNLKQAEREVNFQFAKAASLITGEIGMSFHKDPEDGDFCVFATVKDRAGAMGLMEDLAKGRTFRRAERERRTVMGVEFNALREGGNTFAWAAVDNVLIFSPKLGLLEQCIGAATNRNALDAAARYQTMAARLPARNTGIVYWNPSAMFQALRMRFLPPFVRSWASGVRLGAAMTVSGGVIELRVASNQRFSLRDLFDGLRGAFRSVEGGRPPDDERGPIPLR